jgi:hypothetical protein
MPRCSSENHEVGSNATNTPVACTLMGIELFGSGKFLCRDKHLVHFLTATFPFQPRRIVADDRIA